MAYRRRQGISRASTFKEEIHPPQAHPSDENKVNSSPVLSSSYSFSPSSSSFSSSTSSLAAQAIRASAARHDSSLSSGYGDSRFTSDPLRSEGFDAYEDASSARESKSGFWGVLARKAKTILEDENITQHNEFSDRIRSQPSQAYNISTGGQFQQSYQSPDTFRKMENPTFRKGLDALTSSLNQLGDTFEKAFEEGRTIMETKTADIIKETRKLQIKRKGSSPEDSNANNSWQQSRVQPAQMQSKSNHETQLKASRDVAMATAAKAKLLLRELKTVKADLTFAKERCAQLEEENKILWEGRDKGHSRADDDLIRLQLETLLAEKARLANENEIYARENRFLREIVEYHQLTMQDVVYVDEGTEEVTEVYPISTDGVPRMLSVSPQSSSPPSPKVMPSGSPAVTKDPILPEEDKSISEGEVSPSISVPHEDNAKSLSPSSA
ncbi:Heat-inducible transcription repressor [Quillaja saponaria]|uniref:Heat-inducible transcription repressor n=1 Tax=Quillaja saponaria TaxID=32244 RepID=A0AAD7PMI8_QUISA|nr:Heat-inducible transcription repressor [Quillaja saponaria]